MSPLTAEERALYIKVRDELGDDPDTAHNLCASHQGDDCKFAIPTKHRDGTVTFDDDCGFYLFDDAGLLGDPDDPATCPFVAAFVTEYGAVLVREGL